LDKPWGITQNVVVTGTDTNEILCAGIACPTIWAAELSTQLQELKTEPYQASLLDDPSGTGTPYTQSVGKKAAGGIRRDDQPGVKRANFKSSIMEKNRGERKEVLSAFNKIADEKLEVAMVEYDKQNPKRKKMAPRIAGQTGTTLTS
jgi:hypothetical protein